MYARIIIICVVHLIYFSFLSHFTFNCNLIIKSVHTTRMGIGSTFVLWKGKILSKNTSALMNGFCCKR